MNEWGFAAEIKSWWDAEILAHATWALARCEVERQMEGSAQRSDLTVLDRAGQVRLCGELRLPDHPVPSPWHLDNLSNALTKAVRHHCRWAFTSDGTRLVLMDANRTGPPNARVVHELDLIPFRRRTDLDSSQFLERVHAKWAWALEEIIPIALGLRAPRGMDPDESFINALRAMLQAPVAAIRNELNHRRSTDPTFERDLIIWMVDEQGWSHDPKQWEDEVFRTAQLTAYVFTTRLMFYEALRRSQPTLSELHLPNVAATVARYTFQGYFSDAKAKSGDYETLFNWDKVNEFALISDASIPGWQRVISYLAVFDLGRIGYDIQGKIFERLIDPEERYQWGQHYTKPDVVDLMLSLGIPDGDGAVLDPAAGGGTFLVRAYVRKQVLQPGKNHQDRLAELYGIDISVFAATLATVNLAVRSLTFEDNYPRIAARNFFHIQPSGLLMTIPRPHASNLLGSQSTTVELGTVRAVVCNPPYVRIQFLSEQMQRDARVAFNPVGQRVPAPAGLHGLSNYHVYFWLHAAQFLENGGRLVFITAGEWLDSDYGASLQEWLLNHFRIECCIESLAEPWFSEARVGTAVLSAQLCDDPEERASNEVRFVLLRKPLRQLYGDAASDAEHIAQVDALRDRLLRLPSPSGEGDEFDWSVINQHELWRLGLRGRG